MNLLALDTSTEMLSLALSLHQGEMPAEAPLVLTRDTHAGQSHSKLILPEIEAMLREAGTDRHSLQGIVFGMGPGSFTGLRIACGVAQGLAFGLGVPVLGIGSLLAVADAAGAETGTDKVLVALDARMGEVYVAAYQRARPTKASDSEVSALETSAWHEVIPPCLCAPQQLPELPDTEWIGADWIGAGSGWEVYGDILLAACQGKVTRWQGGMYPRAANMLSLARPRLLAGLGVSAAEAAPLYVRNKVALTRQERAA